jgi:hypothetical protein
MRQLWAVGSSNGLKLQSWVGGYGHGADPWVLLWVHIYKGILPKESLVTNIKKKNVMSLFFSYVTAPPPTFFSDEQSFPARWPVVAPPCRSFKTPPNLKNFTPLESSLLSLFKYHFENFTNSSHKARSRSKVAEIS